MKKQLRKLHVEGKEYLYSVKRGSVNIFDTQTRQIVTTIDFPDYFNITPSEVKSQLINKLIK
jgi:hypothetical protein